MNARHSDDDDTMRDVSSALDYWPSPPPWGWTSEDLDRLPSEGPNGEPDFFKHVELIDGVLVFRSPSDASTNGWASACASCSTPRPPRTSRR